MAGRPDHIQKLSLLVQANTTQLKGEMDKLRGQFKQTNMLAKQMGGIIAGAFGVREVGRFIKSSIEMSSKLKGVEDAFKRINEVDPVRLLQDLRKATRGLTSDLDLMSKANFAQKMGISMEQLPTLLNYARRVAKETGQDVNYLVDSIVTGLGRKSVMILDNLGISSTRLRKELETTSDWAEAVGRIIKEDMAKAGPETETVAERFQQLNIEFQNLKTEIGEKLTPVALELLKSLRDILDTLNGISDWKGVKGAGKSLFDFFYKYSAMGFARELAFGDSFKGKKEDSGFRFYSPERKGYNPVSGKHEGFRFYQHSGTGGGTPEESISRMNTELERLSSISAELPGAGENGILGGALLGPNPELVGEAMAAFNERLLEVVNNVQGSAGILGQGFQDVFGQFASAFVSGKNVLSQMLDYFKKWAAAMIAKLLAVAAAAFILSRLFPGLGAVMGASKGLSGFKGVFQGLGGFGGGVEAFKNIKGGMGLVATVTGDQLNFVMSEYNRKRSTTY